MNNKEYQEMDLRIKSLQQKDKLFDGIKIGILFSLCLYVLIAMVLLF